MRTDRKSESMKRCCGICDDVIYDALCNLFRTHHIIRSILFGSFARGDQSRKSDIDLLLIQETSERFFDRYEGIYTEISQLLKTYPVDLLIYTEAELNVLSSRKFIQTIMREGVTIYEQKTATL